MRGERARVTVTTTLDALRQQLDHTTTGLHGTATAGGDLGWHGPVSAQAVRALACDAELVPAVLGGAGEVLDLGRGQRTVNRALRRALAVRDRGCVFPGCDRPPGWTDAHHGLHWADGGATDLTNLALFCTRHHHGPMHHGWALRIGTDGLPRVIPPPWVDPDRAPRQHHRFRPLRT